MPIPADTDILIAGAGPTGLMLGNQLGRRGTRAVIIDRSPGPSIQTKALGVQARTLEIYSRLGIADRALELGQRATGANMWVEGRRVARVPLGDIGRDLSPYPFLLILGQDDNERLLGERLADWGMEVHWDTELVGLEQHAGHVTATLKCAGGSTCEIQARWVAGCDGAHSAVRNLSGIVFPGARYEHVFFVADTTVTGPIVPDELNIYLWRNGFHLFFPMRGEDHWRVVGIVPRELRARDGLEFADVVPSVRENAGATLEFQNCRWFDTYRIHHRCAQHFREGRCFVLGDAAHIHSPVGAQGMNTGLQDAYNLAWKFALVAGGHADDGLLDTYEAERLPVAERLLDTTDRAFAFIVSERWLGGFFRTWMIARILAFAMGRDRMRELAFRTISQIGIRYRTSPLSETLPGLPESAPRAGDRFPWLRLSFSADAQVEDLYTYFDDTRFNLIVVGQPGISTAETEFSSPLVLHKIPDNDINDRELVRARIPKPSFFLLRPDGHIGLAGTKLITARVNRYLNECCLLLSAPLPE